MKRSVKYVGSLAMTSSSLKVFQTIYDRAPVRRPLPVGTLEHPRGSANRISHVVRSTGDVEHGDRCAHRAPDRRGDGRDARDHLPVREGEPVAARDGYLG